MAEVAAAVANGGKLMKPAHRPTGSSTPTAARSSTIEPRGAVDGDEARRPRRRSTEMMEARRREAPAPPAQLPGIEVAGKTGTAETQIGARPSTTCGSSRFAPADNPHVAVAVTVEGVAGLRRRRRRADRQAPCMESLLQMSERARHRHDRSTAATGSLARLGSGGMADVYCAEDQQLGRQVALKLLHRALRRGRRSSSSASAARRRRAAGLQHPNVVGVYDRGEWDGTYYIAMEYLDGPLAQAS